MPKKPVPDPGQAGATHPARRCSECGEWLPHACAPLVIISRAKWSGRRVVQIVDRPGVADDA